jgi:ascorbate-specific PTS system EIIC-type component UlaA
VFLLSYLYSTRMRPLVVSALAIAAVVLAVEGRSAWVACAAAAVLLGVLWLCLGNKAAR